MKHTMPSSVLLLTVTAAIIFCSCEKDENENSTTKTKTELITAGSWNLTNVTTNPAQDVDGDGDKETSVFDHLENRIKDNITVFKPRCIGIR